MNNLDLILPPWEIVSLDMVPSPVFEAIPLQWKCIVDYVDDNYQGHDIVEFTTETIQKGYYQNKKLFITAKLPLIMVNGKKTVIRPNWFPKGFFFD